MREALLRRHRHLYEKNKENSAAKLPIIRSLADIGRNYSTSRSKSNYFDIKHIYYFKNNIPVESLDGLWSSAVGYYLVLLRKSFLLFFYIRKDLFIVCIRCSVISVVIIR